jgi:hypothetical protein
MSKKSATIKPNKGTRRPRGISPTIEIPPDGDSYVPVAVDSLEARVGYGSLLRQLQESYIVRVNILPAGRSRSTIIWSHGNDGGTECVETPNNKRACTVDISPEQRVAADHPLRPIRKMTDEIFKQLSPRFELD